MKYDVNIEHELGKQRKYCIGWLIWMLMVLIDKALYFVCHSLFHWRCLLSVASRQEPSAHASPRSARRWRWCCPRARSPPTWHTQRESRESNPPELEIQRVIQILWSFTEEIVSVRYLRVRCSRWCLSCSSSFTENMDEPSMYICDIKTEGFK